MNLDEITEFVFGKDDGYVGVILQDSTPDGLHCLISDVYLRGCFLHNAMCSKETHAVVSRRMASRLGIRVVVLQDASICLPFVADCTRYTQILGGALDRSLLAIERHGSADTLFVVRFEIFFPGAGTFLDNRCGR
jgi:hypothetical protein